MKKIWVLLGGILLFVLILGLWLFIWEFGGLANLLGDKSSDIQDNSKLDFVGNWNTENLSNDSLLVGVGGTYSFSSAGTGTFGGIKGNWRVIDNILNINCTDKTNYEYYFRFSKDKNSLFLTCNNVEIEFVKK